MFVISLDFELFWGVHDVRGPEYFPNIKNVYDVVPSLLNLFDEYGVKSTWATVGLIGLASKDELRKFLVALEVPTYVDSKYSPFVNGTVDSVQGDVLFGPKLIRQIVGAELAELASHTLSHFYVLEDGQTSEQFDDDCFHTRLIFQEKYNSAPKSIVFPRNQVNKNYFSLLEKHGITAFRGTPKHWAYKTESRSERSVLRRLYRILDCYLPITQDFGCKVQKQVGHDLYDVPATLFLRPYSKTLRFIEPLKIWRLKYAMKRAAKKGEIFHLWWHPHNFSNNTDKNLKNLRKILDYYQVLSKRYSWHSYKMEEVVKVFRNEKDTCNR